MLDLAPEAPWRCPDELPVVRTAAWPTWGGSTAAWSSRRSKRSRTSPGDEVAELLGQAEDIVNDVAPDVLGRGAQAEDAQAGALAAQPLVAPEALTPGRPGRRSTALSAR